MATQPIGLATLLEAIPRLPRPTLARLIDRMVDRLDELDGDCDLEDGGDTEGIDEREPEEEFGLAAGSPLQSRQIVAIEDRATPPRRWHASISTGAVRLAMTRAA